MRDRILGVGLLLCSLGLFGAAAWEYFGPEDGPGLIADQPEREISGCSPGQTQTLTFAFHNRARHPVQIVGLAPCWGRNCRFGTKREPPYDIPAGTTDSLDCTLEVLGPGEFAGQLHVYVNDAGLREIVLSVQGRTESSEPEGK